MGCSTMQYVGVIRRIDPMGRIVIPKEYRDKLKMSEHDPVEVLLMNNSLVVKKTSTACAFCGTSDDLLDFEDGMICLGCAEKIKRL